MCTIDIMQQALTSLLPESPPSLRDAAAAHGSSDDCSTTDVDDERIGFTHVRRDQRWSHRLRRSLTKTSAAAGKQRNAYSVSDLATLARRQARSASPPAQVQCGDVSAKHTTATQTQSVHATVARRLLMRLRHMICCSNINTEYQPIAAGSATNSYQAI